MDNTVNFRKANVDDIDILAKIRSFFLVEVDDSTTEEDRIKLEMANKQYFQSTIPDEKFVAWLAIDNDRIIATSGLSFSIVPPNQEAPDGKVAYVMNIYTLPEYRGKGLGTKLFELIVDEAKSRGYKKITLCATDAGKPLYTKYGFTDAVGDMVYLVGNKYN